jgi:phage-related protein
MSRAKRAHGEKPLFWFGSSLNDLLAFPETVKDAIGAALGSTQFGGKHPSVKPWKGTGTGVFEVVEDYRGDAYRAIYTVRFAHAVYVLHAFQKKSPSGTKTPKKHVELINQRLKLAQEDYEAQHDH